MTACKYYDCGWCYAPEYLITNSIQGGCFEPEHCPSQMSDLKFTSPSGETTIKVQDTGRLGTIAPKTQLHIRKTPMTEIEEVKAQIQVLQKKLDFLEELEKTKTPVEEAYKRVYGNYPMTDVGDTYWEYFQDGYIAAQKDYKVGEFQEPVEEPEELKTLYQMFYDKYWPKPNCDVFCDIVKEWMSQYTHNVMTGEYLKGYEECLTVLEENLK